MIKIDLITGFLGSGKTTFIRRYADYLTDKGNRICILENDFGAVNVDMLMLQDLLSDKCDLEMISGACDKDCHKRRFKTKLISMAMRGFDRIIIEPSGIYDVDEFFDTLHEPPVDNWYEIGNVITIVDSAMEENMSAEAENIAANQIAAAGKIIFSKCDENSEEQILRTKNYLKKMLKKLHCNDEIDSKIIAKNLTDLSNEDFESIINSGYNSDSYEKLWSDSRQTFESLYFMNKTISPEDFRKKALMILNNENCGKIFRIKGFMPADNGGWIELNATHRNISIKPVEKGQEVFIIIGEKLDKNIINEIIEK